MTVAPQDYTAAMRIFPAAVNVITTAASPSGEERAGLTATAVMSLTAEPPQLGIAVNRATSAHPRIAANGCFCVNTLSAGQSDVAWRFAGRAKGEERFAGAAWRPLATGAPALEGAILNLDCRVASTLELSSHTLFVGTVEAARLGDERRPLLFVEGAWASLLPGAAVDMERFVGGVEQSIAMLERTLASGTDPGAQLRAVVRDLTAIYVERRAVMRDYRLAEVYVPPESLERLKAAKRAFDRRLAALLRQGAESGAFDLDDASLAAFAIEGMVAWVDRWFRPDGRLSAEEVGERLAVLAERMLRKD